MELNTHERVRPVSNFLIDAIMGIEEPSISILEKRLAVNGVLVILGGGEIPCRPGLHVRLILAAIALFQVVNTVVRQ